MDEKVLETEYGNYVTEIIERTPDNCAVIIDASGSSWTVKPDSSPTLEWLQEAVKDNIEFVSVRHDGKDMDMIVAETGKLRGLPVNAVATEIAKTLPHDVLVGTCVLLKGTCRLE